MTICLALLCEGGRSIVAAADRMVSDPDLSLEVEQETRKIELVGSSFAILSAGDALAPTELIRDVDEQISNLGQPSVRDVANSVKDCYMRQRQDLAETLVLQRAGLDYDTFLEKQQSLSETFVVGLASEYQSVELGVDLLLVGVGSSEAHLYTVTDPGTIACFDYIGYAVIGSGQPHAEGFLAEAEYSRRISLKRGILLAHFAKRRSERAPGVGSRFTDILTIEAGNEPRFLDQSTISNLDALYECYLQQVNRASQEIETSMNEMPLSYEIGEEEVNND